MPDIPAEPSPSEIGTTPSRTGGLILTELKEKGIPDLNTLARDLGVQGFCGPPQAGADLQDPAGAGRAETA